MERQVSENAEQTIDSTTAGADALTASQQEAPQQEAVVAQPLDVASAVVTIPGTRRTESRPSLWKRISMRAGAGTNAATERVLARLDVIEARVTTSELSIGNRIQRLDDRFTEVWEVEEQLSQMNELRETLLELSSHQSNLDEKLRGITRRLTITSALVVVGIVAGVVAALAP